MRGIEPRCDRTKIYEEYYLNQGGRGLPAFAGARYQRGHGLGNVLRTLAKVAVPLFKKGVNKVGKQALRTGMAIAGDLMQGQNVKKAAKRRLSQGLTELVTQHGRGQKHKRIRLTPPGERVKKMTHIMKKAPQYKRKVHTGNQVISHSAKRRRTSKDALS